MSGLTHALFLVSLRSHVILGSVEAPTGRVTRLAQAFIDEDVLLALRVQVVGEDHRHSRFRNYVDNITMWPHLIHPAVTILKGWCGLAPRHPETSDRSILALTENGGRVLLNVDAAHRGKPVSVRKRLPEDVGLFADVELFESDRVVKLSVGDHHLIVDNVDFKVLLKAVAGGTVTSPALSSQLKRLQRVGNSGYIKA